MKKILMTVSEEFYYLMLRSMLSPDTLLVGTEFYFDTFRQEALPPNGIGEGVPVLACNAAFHRFMVGKGKSATYHIRDSDERWASEQEEKKAAESRGWTFQELPGVAFGNLDGEVVPLNEEARRLSREKTFHEIMFGKKTNTVVQKEYEGLEDDILKD